MYEEYTNKSLCNLQIKKDAVGNGSFKTGDQGLQSQVKTVVQHCLVDPCLNKTYASALSAEENRNASPCWRRPVVLVRTSPPHTQERAVEVTWNGQNSYSVVKFCRTHAVTVVRIIVVKISETSNSRIVCFEGVHEKYRNLELICSCRVASIHRHQQLAMRVAVLRFILMQNSDFCTD